MNKKAWNVSNIANFEVCCVTGEKLGILADVLPTNSNDIWVVKNDNPQLSEILIPALNTVIKKVDMENKKITVDLPLGLKEIYIVKESK